MLESTGFFTDREGAQKHLDAGAKKVVISAPATDPDITVVLGVNDDTYDPDAAPHHLERLLHDELRRADGEGAARHVRRSSTGFMTTIHAYTNDQQRPRHAAQGPAPRPGGRDQPDPDLDRRRPAIGLVLPELQGKLDGISIRAPVPTGSVTDLVAACRARRPSTR